LSDLLPEADYKEGSENSRNQCKICVGKYLFVDANCGIRNVSGQGMSNSSLKPKIEPYEHQNRDASKARGSYNSRFGGSHVGGAEVDPNIEEYDKQNHSWHEAGILPTLNDYPWERYGENDQECTERERQVSQRCRRIS
jgi:hypothetical protein